MTAPSKTAAAQPPGGGSSPEEEKHRLTALEGLAALSLDALSSVAYGPQAIIIVLATAGVAALHYTLPVTLAIVLLLAVLVISYRQVIEAFPSGGGAYAVAKAHLGVKPSLVAAASLVVDYVLNAAVGVSAGVEALTSAFPQLYPDRVVLCLVVLAVITAANLWGVAESARLFIAPTVLFIAAIFAVIIAGLLRSHPLPFPHGSASSAPMAVGILLLLRAFASGCSALTGVEAIANAVPEFREPRARRAQHTEAGLGVILGLMLIGIAVLADKFKTEPSASVTTLAQLTQGSLGHNFFFYVVQLLTTVLLALAANTSFGGLPVLASLLATDNFLPHLFFLRAQRQVHRYGVVVLAVLAAALLVASDGSTQALIPLFAIGVFVGFTLSQAGMVRHWRLQGGSGWQGRAIVNGVGAVFTLAALLIELISKFTEGAWLVVIVVPLLVLMFAQVHTIYTRMGRALEIGRVPEAPDSRTSTVVVPVATMSRLVRAGITAALSIGDEVIAVTVCFEDPVDQSATDKLRAQWDRWDPGVPLVTLHSTRRSLAEPLVDYLRELERTYSNDQLVVLIPEVQPARRWQAILHNQRGFVLEQAIQHSRVNVVICRLRYRLSAVATTRTAADRLPGGPELPPFQPPPGHPPPGQPPPGQHGTGYSSGPG
ncbi:MAG TPA: amino acid permease [Streptosporangiaceae bacterium]|nr:amino acid permease [Streptosporangiaceae bacterium]